MLPRKTVLPFSLPDITEKEIRAVEKVLTSRWLTMGKVTEEFEQKIQEYTGSKYAVVVGSGTAGLHLALKSLDVKEGESVLLPAFTFTATAEVVWKCRAVPVFLDVDRETYLLTANIVEDHIKKYCEWKHNTLFHIPTKTTVRGILCVHYGGRVCDLNSLKKVAKKYHLFLGEDAAHAFGSEYRGKPLGTFSDFTVFSFYATKNITSGEGGAIVTNHAEIARRTRRMRLHGFDRETYRRKNADYDIIDEGFKYNISDIHAAIGIVQLQRNQEMLQRRQFIHRSYQEAFRSIPGIRLTPEDPGSSFHLYTLEVRNRKKFMEKLKSYGIQTSIHFKPLYRMTYYKRKITYSLQDFPNTESIYAGIVSLPIYSAMSDEDIHDVVEAVKRALE